MARNKYPEETVEKILAVSMRLFIEKGYEHTSIQDIIDELGGLSKGAIYHHFKSKEDILLAGIIEASKMSEEQRRRIRDEKGITGLEKLRKLMEYSFENPLNVYMTAMAPNILNNSKLLVAQLLSTIENAAPNYVKPILEAGVADGSIQTEYPEELAEALLMLSDIWLNPLIFSSTEEQLRRKGLFFCEFLRRFGLDVMDSPLIQRFMELWNISAAKKDE
jgi:AcrR family transcriptional regulator